MEIDSEVLDECTEQYFKLIIKRLTSPNKESVINQSLVLAKSQLEYGLKFKLLEEEEREALTVYLSWLFNTLLSIAVNDKNGE
jgi:hypothetical protein